MESASMMLLILFFVVIIVALVSPLFLYMKRKNNKEQSYNQYKKFFTKNRTTDYQSVSYKNMVEMDIDVNSKQLGLYCYNNSTNKILNFNEIIDFELSKNGGSASASFSSGRMGEVLTNTFTSQTFSDLKLKIYTNNVSNSVVTLDFIEKYAVYSNSEKFKEISGAIDEMTGFLKIILEKYNKE